MLQKGTAYLHAVEIKTSFARIKKEEKTRWERVRALSLKPRQLNLKITASCTKRVSTLNTSSMKSFLEGRRHGRTLFLHFLISRLNFFELNVADSSEMNQNF
jgi:hypothetical protein